MQNNASAERIATGDYDARRDVANIGAEADKAVASTQKDATLGKAEIDKDSSTETQTIYLKVECKRQHRC